MNSIGNKIPKVVFLTLNWNGWKDTLECLESVFQNTYPAYELIVIDNGSKDNSIEKIYEYCNKKIPIDSYYFQYNSIKNDISILRINKHQALTGIKPSNDYLEKPFNEKLILISLKKNFGFTGGVNIGSYYALKVLKPDYIFLLNNDTVVEKELLNEIIQFSELSKKIGIVGPEIRLYQNSKKLQFERKYDGITSPIEDYHLSGCALLIKTRLIRKIGLLDPIFKNYYEETDYIARARKAGFKSFYVPTKNKVYHKFAATSRKIPGFNLFFMTRNFIIFNKKHCDFKTHLFNVYKFFKSELKFHLNSRNLYHFLNGFFAGLVFSVLRKRV